VADTQQIGVAVIGQLGAQREGLTNAIERQGDMDTMLTRSYARALRAGAKPPAHACCLALHPPRVGASAR